MNNLEIDNQNKSPRFTKLGESIINWVNSYPENEFDNVDEGIELLVLGVDNKHKARLCFMLGDNINPIDSAFNAINYGIGNFKNKDNHLEQDVFTGVADYIARVCANNPYIWTKFKEGVEKYITEINDNIQEG